MKRSLALAAFTAWLILAAPQAWAQANVHSSFDLHVPLAPAPVHVEGGARLTYELHLRSFSQDTLTLQSVEVLADDEAVLAELREDALSARLGGPGSPAPANERRTIAPGAQAVLYLEVTLKGHAPRALRHRITYAGAGGNPSTVVTVEGGHTRVASTPPAVLGPPLRGGPWAAVYEPSWERGHRRMFYAVEGRARLPGRHAIDWILLDAQGRNARGDADRISNWFGYAAEVLAVADATVAAVRDDVAESATVSGQPHHALADGAGNYVTLDLGDGRFVFYEHLKPGSVRVKRGQRVRRGEVIAALGFTGHSTGPHLHFHVADANSSLGAEGLPFVLDGFELLGRYDRMERFGHGPWSPRDPDTQPQRQKELPGPNSVIRFDAAQTR